MKRRKFIGKTALGTLASVGLPSIVPASVFGKNAPSNKINIGQIGCGRIARSHDLIDTMAYDVANVMAVCDLDFKRMEGAKELVDKLMNGNILPSNNRMLLWLKYCNTISMDQVYHK